MTWRGMAWTGTDADLVEANRQHAIEMAKKQAHAADLQKAVLLAKGRC